jgi:predicted permease
MFLKRWFRRRTYDLSELDRELRDHIELEIERLQDEGLDAESARRLAVRDLGNATNLKETVYEMRPLAVAERWRTDVRLAIRALRRRPAFTLVALLSLTLGIGANTAIFTLADQILIRQLPVDRPDTIVSFRWEGQFIGGTSRGLNGAFSYPAFQDIAADPTVATTAIAARWRDEVTIGSGTDIRRAIAEVVSGNYFDVLGVRATLGRILSPADDADWDGAPYVVLSHTYWKTRFGSSPDVLGHTIRVNSVPMTIVGVAAERFGGFDVLDPANIFIPLKMKRKVTGWDDRERRDSIWLTVFTRLRPDITRETAAEVLAPRFAAVLRADLAAARRSEEFKQTYLKNRLTLLDASRGSEERRESLINPLRVLLVLVGILFLIACVNVANLIIARSMQRAWEIAVRASLGASRVAIVRLIMSETVVLAGAGGILGLIVSTGTSQALIRMLPFDWVGRAVHSQPDLRILAFTLALSILSAVIAGVVPALRAAAPKAKQGVEQVRVRRTLVATQVALALALLVGAGLFVKSLHTLFEVNTGLSRQLLTFSIDTRESGRTTPQVRQLVLDVIDRVSQLPSVISAGTVTPRLLSGNHWQNTIRAEGYEPGPSENMQAGWNMVMPGLFSALEVPILAGRDFSEADREGAPATMVVNESLARRFFGSAHAAVGRHIGFGGSRADLKYEIIGVVKDFKEVDLRSEVTAWTFTSGLLNLGNTPDTFYVRTATNPLSIAYSLRTAVLEIEPSAVVYNLKTIDQQLADTHYREIVLARLSTGFAALAALLACVGLYGITSFAVARRTKEFGIRIALGAPPSNIFYVALSETVRLILIGAAIGAVLSLGLQRVIHSELYNWKGIDWLMSFGAIVALVGVSLLSSSLPAMRAVRANPQRALRSE